ncbi:pyridoxamine kinase [Kurthia sibirica]|uniref:pyridoxal kinase n=1 Tax=Kurthia sibirica TaxID=202750 RepID=A0A2U3ANJ8_9BACL|nr:pyridoxamine kinase [Kurthia sibirica]PWI26108.1 pyridoxamine kinase [Kurthia sibirica]GEK34946.1 pyridoxal kinase [Kurthia sibirica]
MKKVAVIQDLSSFGKCSLTVAIPILSVMQTQAVPLPTAILTSQTGYSSFFCEDLTNKMHHFENEWSKMDVSFEGIYTGFVTGEEQINHIFSFLEKFRHADTVLLVDPVMGDDGKAYTFFTPSLLARMKALVSEATVITPNVTESCLLSGLNYDDLAKEQTAEGYMAMIRKIGQRLQKLTTAKIIMTGIHPPSDSAATSQIGTAFFDGEQIATFFTAYNGKSYSGTGDIFASIMMGSIMRGDSLLKGLSLAEQFISTAIADTALSNTPKEAGINFEKFLKLLI